MSNYNQARYIKQALDSILMQKVNFDYQIIITDDCSMKDNSIEIIKEYENKYPNIIKTIFAKENGGYLKNILRAKSITKTDYFCLLDADDYWIDDCKLQKAFDFFESNPEYVIYSTNTLCIYEDLGGGGVSNRKESHSFIGTDIKEADYTIDDLIKSQIAITQTTGTVFRNVIFKNGIPQIMQDAVGTISERSFEGDTGRYVMHLKYGKAKFINFIDGVYRITSAGIWQRLNEVSKQILTAQSFLSYNDFYENKYREFFYNFSYSCLLEILKELRQDFLKQDVDVDKVYYEILCNVLKKINQNRDIINPNKNRKIKVKDKIRLFVWKSLNKKLERKGLV
jgi:glycosyltransferase involved in cell wall biosynthesis